MQCPNEIAEILLEILERGLLKIRAAGWEGNSNRCAIEADHLHNVPALIASYSPERLRYYWEAERVSFIQQSSAEERRFYEEMWDRLADLMGLQKNGSLAKI